jgi:hypothetical protein
MCPVGACLSLWEITGANKSSQRREKICVYTEDKIQTHFEIEAATVQQQSISYQLSETPNFNTDSLGYSSSEISEDAYCQINVLSGGFFNHTSRTDADRDHLRLTSVQGTSAATSCDFCFKRDLFTHQSLLTILPHNGLDPFFRPRSGIRVRDSEALDHCKCCIQDKECNT